MGVQNFWKSFYVRMFYPPMARLAIQAILVILFWGGYNPRQIYPTTSRQDREMKQRL